MLTAEQVSSLIASAATWAKGNRLERRNVHLSRICEIISENLCISKELLTNPQTQVSILELYEKFLQRHGLSRPEHAKI
jgi:hypothetical protein